MAEEQERERQEPEKPADGEFYRPSEDDRLQRARAWIRQARGLPPEPEE